MNRKLSSPVPPYFMQIRKKHYVLYRYIYIYLYTYIYIDMETPYHFNPHIVIKVKVIKHRQLKL